MMWIMLVLLEETNLSTNLAKHPPSVGPCLGLSWRPGKPFGC